MPKRIINDAIGAGQSTVDFYGFEFDQITFLVILCFAFLLSVIAHGVTKMKINTYKGVMSERMLRRFRFTLISRILRFPQPYVRNTSQGELVSMITSESEPMGGMMGDAISQPILQAGQMATILFFLFAQNALLGLAAVALIPVQAWLIPKLQRQINVYNKKRIVEVRHLAAEIGESAAGAATLRTHGGWRYRQSLITRRLGILFNIRLVIYQKKFFMKFLNNFITQLTPFFFFLVGGYLVIEGQVTLGALVAALAAYKDLSAPWKELLTYYNQVQELGQRWELITERFAPEGMIDETLFEGRPDDCPHLSGPVEMKNVAVHDSDGNVVLEGLNANWQGGSQVLVMAPQEEDRHALAEVLTREVLPASGSVVLSGHPLRELHQTVVAARIGHADPRPYVFDGTFGRNVMMALTPAPRDPEAPMDPKFALEAERSGNSTDPLETDWLDPGLAGLEEAEEVLDWWLELVEGIGSGPELFQRALDQSFDPEAFPELAEGIVALREKVIAETADMGEGSVFYRFDPEQFNPAISIAGNLFYAKQRTQFDGEDMAAVHHFAEVLRETGQEEALLKLSQEVVEMLRQTFGADGTDHPLFRMLGLVVETFETKVDLVRKSRKSGLDSLDDEERAQILALLFEISAEKIGPAFTDDLKNQVLDMRRDWAGKQKDKISDHFEPLDKGQYFGNLSIIENALFGRLSSSGTSGMDALYAKVADILQDAGLRRHIAKLIHEVPTGLGGVNLSSAYLAPLSLSRAAIKKPDILVLDSVLAGLDTERRETLLDNLRGLLPNTTLIVLEEGFEDQTRFDTVVHLENGRFRADGEAAEERTDNAATADLNRKMRALRGTDLFSGLARKQLRLLAFGAKWYEAEEGEYVFHQGDPGTDGAYLILEGEAGIYAPQESGDDFLVATAGAGALVGELALIRKEPRALDMKVHKKLEALRLGEQEFLAVVENDAQTAFKIMQVIAGYIGAANKSSDDD
ncbi:cyclic nucleotide-binding domain-containing protein [Shimia biformata]|uniref:cyclic nucleotide-binding domain-containing protein n=1 Tax=Shimia biformata TaxID=1294299 RepID=UPI001EF20EC1|nr:cyclic nucleotide-binding domain-containing protein [Shimia biformata]